MTIKRGKSKPRPWPWWPRLSIMLVFIACAFLLTGCITCKKQFCPSEDMVSYIATPFGPVAAIIEKDFFNEKNKNNKWMTEKDFRKIMMEESITPNKDEEEFVPQEGSENNYRPVPSDL